MRVRINETRNERFPAEIDNLSGIAFCLKHPSCKPESEDLSVFYR